MDHSIFRCTGSVSGEPAEYNNSPGSQSTFRSIREIGALVSNNEGSRTRHWIVCRLSLQRQMSLWAEAKESQERTWKDEWNWGRIRMAGDVVLRDAHVLISVAYEYVKW